MPEYQNIACCALDPWPRVRFPVRAEASAFATPSLVSDPNIRQKMPTHKVTFSMRHEGASRNSPRDAPWEIWSQKYQLANFCKPLTPIGIGKIIGFCLSQP